MLLQDDEGGLDKLDASREHFACSYPLSSEVSSIVVICTEHWHTDYLTMIDGFDEFNQSGNHL